MDFPHTAPYVNGMPRKPAAKASPKAEPATRAEAMAETREKLLRAGAALFAEHGLDGPSLDGICEAAGYTRGAFYVHFQDRDDFMVAVMEREGLPFLDAVLGGAADPDAPAPTLETVVGRFLEAVASGAYPLTREGGPRPHQLLDACARSKKIRTRYVSLVGDAIARLARVVAASQAEGQVRGDVDAAHVATVLLAAVIGAQTMIELDAPLDLLGAGTTLTGLLRAPREKRARR